MLLQQDDPNAFCGYAPGHALGCAILQRNANQCTVVLKSRMPPQAESCAVTHELRHCFGDFHHAFDNRPHYSIDCGNGEFYGGPV